MAAIEVDDIHRSYRTSTGTVRRRAIEVEAVRGVSFDVAPGELFGLLGPNGAGKTTTIKMLIMLLIPTRGSARVLGYDVVEHPQDVRRRVGYRASPRSRSSSLSAPPRAPRSGAPSARSRCAPATSSSSRTSCTS